MYIYSSISIYIYINVYIGVCIDVCPGVAAYVQCRRLSSSLMRASAGWLAHKPAAEAETSVVIKNTFLEEAMPLPPPILGGAFVRTSGSRLF